MTAWENFWLRLILWTTRNIIPPILFLLLIGLLGFLIFAAVTVLS